MKLPFQVSLWLPAAVLVVGIALVLSLLMAAEQASMTGTAASYPPPASNCIFLTVIRRDGATVSADAGPTAAYAPAPAGPAAYPPPSICKAPTKRLFYLPVVRR
jgi:hypothetical protein